MKNLFFALVFLASCAQTRVSERTFVPSQTPGGVPVAGYQPFGTPFGSNQQASCPMVDPSSLPAGMIYGSLRPFFGSNVTFVENNTDFFISRIRVSGKSGPMKEVVLFDGCAPQPEVGLPPHKRVYFRFCPCGEDVRTGMCKAVLPGTKETTACRVEADVEFRTWEEFAGLYKPSDTIAGRGCEWKIFSPRSTDPEDNRIVIEPYRLGRSCS